MQDAVLDHPSEDVLERFLFRNSSLDETEVIEDHIVGCGDCITRLEDLEDYAAVFRQASYELAGTRVCRLKGTPKDARAG